MDIKILGKHQGKTVQSYTLKNKSGMELEVLNLGGIIKSINYNGKNRVLGFDDYRDYIGDPHHFGATVGPVAGRISGAEFKLGDKTYKLTKNEGENSLHGGEASLTRKVWTLYETRYNGVYESFTLKCRARDGEGGYPGNRDFYTKFTLNDDNEVIIEYRIKTDRETYASLTNHSYFNFNDHLEEEVLNHQLYIDAEEYLVLDGESLPKERRKVEGTVFDFRKKKSLGKDFDLEHRELKATAGYDHPFILGESGGVKAALSYKDIEMTLETTEPALVVYTANGLNKRTGVCLEAQAYPDGMNKSFLGMDSIGPEREYYSRTIYSFK